MQGDTKASRSKRNQGIRRFPEEGGTGKPHKSLQPEPAGPANLTNHPMSKLLPAAEIINDLLAENWELRWRVFEVFYRTRLFLHDFSRSSREYRQARELCREMANRLNGPSDINLHLVLTAAWFLGGSHFLLLVLEKLGVDDPETADPETLRCKKPLNANQPEADFYDYFHSLLRRGKALDAATGTAIRIFPPETGFNLLCAIPEAESRQAGIRLLRQHYPEIFFNRILLEDDPERLEKLPELVEFISPPLSDDANTRITELVASLLEAGDPRLDFALGAVSRLQLESLLPQLQKLPETPRVLEARTRLGDRDSCHKLLKTATSWRRGKRAEALSRLGACRNQPEVLKLLQERLRKGNAEERRIALNSLTDDPDPQVLEILLARVEQNSDHQEQRLLLGAIAAREWSDLPAEEGREISGRLAGMAEIFELYPELTAAAARFPYHPAWGDFLRGKVKTPILKPHYREIALFMTRFAERENIRLHLRGLLLDVDWAFSYRLLSLMAPVFTSADVPLLLRLLQDREEHRELTIKERLTRGRDLEQLPEALAEFFQQQPAIARQVVEKLLTGVVTGKFNHPEKLFAELQREPPELAGLLLGPAAEGQTAASVSLPRLLAWHLLSAIEVDGSDCFALVVHRTRRYAGYFRQRIFTVIDRLLEQENELQAAGNLPVLQKIIDFIRGRSEFDDLRTKLLEQVARITRQCRDLKVFSEASQTRELIVFKVRKLG